MNLAKEKENLMKPLIEKSAIVENTNVCRVWFILQTDCKINKDNLGNIVEIPTCEPIVLGSTYSPEVAERLLSVLKFDKTNNSIVRFNVEPLPENILNLVETTSNNDDSSNSDIIDRIFDMTK